MAHQAFLPSGTHASPSTCQVWTYLHSLRRLGPVVFIMDGRSCTPIPYAEAKSSQTGPRHKPGDLNTNLHSINNTSYSPVWRLLRRNLVSGVVNPCKASKSSTQVQRMALDILLKSLKKEAKANGGVVVPVHSIQHSVSFLMTSLCFGVALDEDVVDKIKNVQVGLLSLVDNRYALNLLPKEDIVSFKPQFLDASIWPACAALEWIMSRLVKHQDIQQKLKKEIRSVVGDKKGLVDVEELQRMPYLKAVIFEALRRHSPAHFLIPHRVKEDVMIMADHHEYLIPRGAVVNYLVTSVGLDASVWEEPLEFRPERFMPGGEGEEVDVNCGKREIKMMPFGAGRRICPGSDMAVLQLQYLVANFVNEIIELKAVEGMEVDLSDKAELFVAMKNPLGHSMHALSLINLILYP
ncbi:hypothetical protein J5N97_025097 [Dioscorea zingiberensis]|uniref:Cytochrome P450 n=1 Tax=Dioscorea zingiberensis TaxID=325984 RepID=A0A9D5C883_9LILI|nr:hypothetical protein J5N97_025097 [Dioscorea zingiberensis]